MLGLCAAGATLEGALRLVGVQPDVPRMEPNPYFGWLHIPHSTWWYKGRVKVHTNAHGLRDREFEYAKPAGVRRVLVLGDSMAEGAQVPEAETFPKRLEQLLTAADRPLAAGIATSRLRSRVDRQRLHGAADRLEAAVYGDLGAFVARNGRPAGQRRVAAAGRRGLARRLLPEDHEAVEVGDFVVRGIRQDLVAAKQLRRQIDAAQRTLRRQLLHAAPTIRLRKLCHVSPPLALYAMPVTGRQPRSRLQF